MDDPIFDLTIKNFTKIIRRKSCTNELFGGIHLFELKNYNLKVPKSEFFTTLKISKTFGWGAKKGIIIPTGKGNSKANFN